MSWFPVVLATLGAEYVLGMLLMLIYHYAETGWYDPKQISPRPTRWAYRPWGRPIAVFVDMLIWPYAVAEAVRRGLD